MGRIIRSQRKFHARWNKSTGLPNPARPWPGCVSCGLRLFAPIPRGQRSCDASRWRPHPPSYETLPSATQDWQPNPTRASARAYVMDFVIIAYKFYIFHEPRSWSVLENFWLFAPLWRCMEMPGCSRESWCTRGQPSSRRRSPWTWSRPSSWSSWPRRCARDPNQSQPSCWLYWAALAAKTKWLDQLPRSQHFRAILPKTTIISPCELSIATFRQESRRRARQRGCKKPRACPAVAKQEVAGRVAEPAKSQEHTQSLLEKGAINASLGSLSSRLTYLSQHPCLLYGILPGRSLACGADYLFRLFDALSAVEVLTQNLTLSRKSSLEIWERTPTVWHSCNSLKPYYVFCLHSPLYKSKSTTHRKPQILDSAT